jgi:hypothetical protein
MTDKPKRYQVMAEWPDGVPQNVGEADDPTTQNRIAIAALYEGAVRVAQYDTDPPVPTPATEDEKANLAAILPHKRKPEA